MSKTNPEIHPFAALRASWDYSVPQPYGPADRVYQLVSLADDPRFRPIQIADDSTALRSLLHNPIAALADLKQFAARWERPRIHRGSSTWNDCPWASWEGQYPAFSKQAIQCLNDLVTPHGVWLPLTATGKKYSIFLPQVRNDLLDLKRCNVDRSLRLGGQRVTMFQRHAFKPDRLASTPIFRVKERPTDIFVTDAFVQRVKDCNLLGFHFDIVFPLQPHHDSFNLSLKATKAHLSEGLPPRKRLDSGRIIVRFKLEDRSEISTDRQERLIKTWAERVDKSLLDPRSLKPPTAYLFNVCPEVGEMTATFEGPDASKIIAAIRPHLAKAKWPHEVLIKKIRG